MIFRKETGNSNRTYTTLVFIAVALFLSVRLFCIFFASTQRTIPAPVDDSYAYVVKSAYVLEDFNEENKYLGAIKSLLHETLLDRNSKAKREYHQLFCWYHPLYTLSLEIIHQTFNISYKKSLFILQAGLQILLCFSLLMVLKSFGFNNLIIAAFFLLITFNWGMQNYMFFGYPKHFLPIFSFLLIWMTKNYGRSYKICIPFSIIIILTAAATHVMAYSFVAIPIAAVFFYGLLFKKKSYFNTGIVLLLFTITLGITHKYLIVEKILPGYLSNFTPYADLAINISFATIKKNISEIFLRIYYFSQSWVYWFLFLTGFILGLKAIIKREDYLLLSYLLMFHLVPLSAVLALSPAFSFRLLPMALYLDLVIMVYGYYSFGKIHSNSIKGISNTFSGFRLNPKIALFLIIIAMTIFQIPTFLRNLQYFAFGQPYDVDEKMQKSFVAKLLPGEVVGINANEIIFLASIFNNLHHNPIVYQRYYTDDKYPKKKFIDKMKYYIGEVPWTNRLGFKNSIRINPNETFEVGYQFFKHGKVKGILLAGQNTHEFREVIFLHEGKEIIMSKSIHTSSCQYFLPVPVEIEGKFKIIFKDALSKKLVNSILIISDKSENRDNSLNFDWQYLESVTLVTESDREVFTWQNSTVFGSYRKRFNVIMDDGFSLISAIEKE